MRKLARLNSGGAPDRDVLDDNPSLRAYPAECLPKAYVVRMKALDRPASCACRKPVPGLSKR